MSQSLQDILKHPDIWQASHRVKKSNSITSGYSALDKQLHQSGWPLSRITEVLVKTKHIGEMQLVLPAITKIMKQGGWLFLIEPPFIPYAPAWLKANIDLDKMMIIKSEQYNRQEKDWLWSAEQVISHQGVCCTLFWPPKDNLSNKVLKRLQLAAEHGGGLNFIFRHTSVATQSSPANLRIVVNRVKSKALDTAKLTVDILKQAGGWAGQQAIIDIPQCGAPFINDGRHSTCFG